MIGAASEKWSALAIFLSPPRGSRMCFTDSQLALWAVFFRRYAAGAWWSSANPHFWQHQLEVGHPRPIAVGEFLKNVI